MPEPEQRPAGVEMVVVVPPSRNERYEVKLAQKHAKVVKTACALRPDNGNFDVELHGNKLLVTEREAATRPDGAIRICDVIEQIIAREHIQRPVSPPARMPAPQRCNASDKVYGTPKHRHSAVASTHLMKNNRSDQCSRRTDRTWSLKKRTVSKRRTLSRSRRDAGRERDGP